MASPPLKRLSLANENHYTRFPGVRQEEGSDLMATEKPEYKMEKQPNEHHQAREFWKHLDFLALASVSSPLRELENFSQLLAPLFNDANAVASLGKHLVQLLKGNGFDQSETAIVAVNTGFGFEIQLAQQMSSLLQMEVIDASLVPRLGGPACDCSGEQFDWEPRAFPVLKKRILMVFDWAPSGNLLTSLAKSLQHAGVTVTALCGLFLPLNRSCCNFDGDVILASAWPERRCISPSLPWSNQLECSCDHRLVTSEHSVSSTAGTVARDNEGTIAHKKPELSNVANTSQAVYKSDQDEKGNIHGGVEHNRTCAGVKMEEDSPTTAPRIDQQQKNCTAIENNKPTELSNTRVNNQDEKILASLDGRGNCNSDGLLNNEVSNVVQEQDAPKPKHGAFLTLVIDEKKQHDASSLKRKLTEPLSDIEEKGCDPDSVQKPTDSLVTESGLHVLSFDQATWLGKSPLRDRINGNAATSGETSNMKKRHNLSIVTSLGEKRDEASGAEPCANVEDIHMTPPNSIPSDPPHDSPLVRSSTKPLDSEESLQRPDKAHLHPVKHQVAVVAANSPCEDRFSATYCKELDAWLYMVLDGHGGWIVAEFIKSHLPTAIFDSMQAKIGQRANAPHHESAQGQAVPPGSPPTASDGSAPPQLMAHSAITEILNDAFEKVDKDVLKHVQLRTQHSTTEGSPGLRRSGRVPRNPSATADFTTGRNAGSCAIAVLLFQGFMYVANAGDCRAVIGSLESNAQDPAARARLLAIGGDQTASRPAEQGAQDDCPVGSFSESLSCLQRSPLFSPHKYSAPVRPAKPVRKQPKVVVDPGPGQHPDRQGYRAPPPGDELVLSVEPLSRDHTCDDAGEAIRVVRRSGDKNAIRISKSDSASNNIMGPLRVAGSLIVTRAFGDLYLKGSAARLPQPQAAPGRLPPSSLPYITVAPEVVARAIRPCDEYLIVASDGLWNFLSNEEAMRCVMDQEAGDLAVGPVLQSLRLSAQARGVSMEKILTLPTSKKRRSIHDDITCLVVKLRGLAE